MPNRIDYEKLYHEINEDRLTRIEEKIDELAAAQNQRKGWDRAIGVVIAFVSGLLGGHTGAG